MRKMISVWAIVLLFSSSLFGVELNWEKDTATAFAKAKAEKKNVVLMVEASHCRWCKKMKQQTLADQEVKKRLQNYILVKVLRSDSEAMKILPESYYPAPTTFFMTPEGEIMEKAIGFFEASDFITYINDVEEN
ncbi:thioredoxin family protein [Sulfurovum mangrovi]|uniref:thioredoxin family protein n=1 Tax=Sulfurovum mangrovi TaxID=2893889 RepID=UPI001E4D44D1|nr:thioredoxin family protein [Sulfurovum mangrovi]UFH59730.1 thioredoxin family protein [Sulfurovum mangrovi]UFH60873.1 thioredoxin family protein [Sulfurovum mangrovi]